MKAVLQRVAWARVDVAGETKSEIGPGLVILLGVRRGDTPEMAQELARRCAHSRIFEDEQGKFNRSLLDAGGQVLVVSQFTLLADTSRGRRPSFSDAEEPDQARIIYEDYVRHLRSLGIVTKTGVFGARMRVALENDGPVTLIMEV